MSSSSSPFVQCVALCGLPVIAVGMFEPSSTALIAGAGMLGLPAVVRAGEESRRQRVSPTRRERQLAALRERYVSGEIELEQFERSVVYLLDDEESGSGGSGGSGAVSGENVDEPMFPMPVMDIPTMPPAKPADAAWSANPRHEHWTGPGRMERL